VPVFACRTVDFADEGQLSTISANSTIKIKIKTQIWR
jgi:hypothetical protein